MEHYIQPLLERAISAAASPEQAQALQETLHALLQTYKEAGPKGVTQAIKEEMVRRHSRAQEAIDELKERV